jgi:hypothetical protein
VKLSNTTDSKLQSWFMQKQKVIVRVPFNNLGTTMKKN